MSTRVPDEIPEYWNAQDMNRVLRCLGNAGWLHSGEQAESLEIHYSEKGRAGMRRLSSLIKDYLPKPSEPSPQMSRRDDYSEQVPAIFEKVFVGPLRIAPELFSFSFNTRENNAFVALVIAYALENQYNGGS
jgi:hypothetical protein